MMKKLFIYIITLLLSTSSIFASEKKVLVEIFTNSHCPVCPAAHSALDSYLQTSNADKIEFIYYHIRSPYPDDNLYQHNQSDADAKGSFYQASSSPTAFFGGTKVSNSYSNWAATLNSLILEESNFEISLSGNFSDNEFTISADVTQTGDNSVSDLTINYVVVENVNYTGRNGISNHKNVMREIVNPEGDLFSINLNETKNLSTTISKNSSWNTNNLRVIVSIQSKSTKEVLQSTSIAYSDFSVTSIENQKNLSNTFTLEQNYPNPFNPTTTISYTIPNLLDTEGLNNSQVSLVVYDILGNKIRTLVNKQQNAGNYRINFNATSLSAGFYYYKLSVGKFSETKKMILLK